MSQDQEPFLTPDHPRAFEGLPKLSPQPAALLTELCPQCKGHGGWVLKHDAYPASNPDDARLPFLAHCMQCHGWGYVRVEDAGHVHVWTHKENMGTCLNRLVCSVPGCDLESVVDSSD